MADVKESRVIPLPIEKVWAVIRPLHFKWLSSVKSVDSEQSDDVLSLKTINYKDGTVQKVKVVELSDLQYFITYDVIESNPPVTMMSAIHTIRLRRISHDNTTLIEWESDFSYDAGVNVLEDSRFKKREGFADLVKYLQ
ncbi:hypothetical protein BC833DRAFT_583540 [Globomyces pollinis-pini]|nr:hypothetical protein BC833DRAFT_583540 [Globomyces pollinis-pini]